MDQQAELIRDQQKESWNKFSGGWKKWDELMMEYLKPMGDEIVNYLQPGGNQVILDIAGGTGEPGFTIARKLQGGKVIITDLAEDMLEVARQKATAMGIRNIEFQACDVCDLPFADNSFDAISLRFGFMFFPDMQLAANEILRVLKTGGKIATTVWDVPEKNFWVTATMGTISRLMELPPPPPEAPGMFRCAKPGRMREIFEKAGFKNYAEKGVTSYMNTGTADRYWSMMTEVGAPIVAALSKADDAIRDRIHTEVLGLIKQKYPGNVSIEGNAILITAVK